MFLGAPYSLKKRLMVNLLISSLIPLALIGYISYISLYSLLNNKIENGIENNLKQTETSISNVYSNLNRSSLLLAIDNGRIADKLETYVTTTDLMQKYDHEQGNSRQCNACEHRRQ